MFRNSDVRCNTPRSFIGALTLTSVSGYLCYWLLMNADFSNVFEMARIERKFILLAATIPAYWFIVGCYWFWLDFIKPTEN